VHVVASFRHKALVNLAVHSTVYLHTLPVGCKANVLL
jgi:hypothetical protein